MTTAQRVFHHRHLWRLTPEAFAAGATMLARAAGQVRGPITAVVGIAKGGLPFAVVAADLLDVPRFMVSARHNATDGLYEQATGSVTCDAGQMAHDLDGLALAGTILLVDDICGSSATLAAVRSAMRPHLDVRARVVTAALCLNAGAITRPDLWLWNVADWVVFPWEGDQPTGETTRLRIPAGVQTA